MNQWAIAPTAGVKMREEPTPVMMENVIIKCHSSANRSALIPNGAFVNQMHTPVLSATPINPANRNTLPEATSQRGPYASNMGPS